MKVKIDFDPTVSRVVIIGLLIFLETLLMPIYGVLQSGRYPEVLEVVTYLFGAIITLITYLLAFVKTGQVEPAKNP